jgi:hypothetical protein
MPQKSNKEIEKYYFEMFRRDYPLPIGSIDYGDKPDVILNGERKIGIEITCQAQSNATSFIVRDTHAACSRAWLLHCTANARGVSPSRAPCGRSLLYSSSQ